MSFLLDTNVVSESRKSLANAGVTRWLTTTNLDESYVSVLVIGEIRRGIELIRRRDPRQADILAGWLISFVESFSSRVLPVTLEIAEV